MSDTSLLCICSHSQGHHEGLARKCQSLACMCPYFTTGAHDPVSAPAHYNWIPGVQPIDIAEHLPYNLGAALKYIVRCGRKGDAIEDLRKAAWHIQREIERRTKGAKP